jgi:hypothetical protein
MYVPDLHFFCSLLIFGIIISQWNTITHEADVYPQSRKQPA